jgi:hypothetical protein
VKLAAADCPHCGTENTYYPEVLKFGVKGLIQCVSCSGMFKPMKPKRVGPNDNQKRSRSQEKRAAKRYDAKVQPASGAKKTAKGDIRAPGKIRGECKFTRSASFSLKLAELQKLRKEAKGGEVALFEIEFQGVYPPERFVVLSDNDFLALSSKK